MERIVGQYILERKIGEGGMAEVWQAKHVHLGNIVAVKFLLPSYSGDLQLEERFLDEGKRQAGLQHPNIVSAIDFFQSEGHSYLVMQYVEGQSLEDRLQAHRGPLSLEDVHAISWDVLSALDYAHSQEKPLVHRDVKPSNILLENTGRVLLSDFGIALMVGAERRLTSAGVAIGTPDYMSPEQIVRPKEVDPRSDIYSFGCVLYAMLTGAPPFSSEGATDFSVKDGHVRSAPPPMSDRNPYLSPFVEKVVLACMEKDPANRYQSCRAVMKALDEAMKTAPAALPVVPPPPPPAKVVAPPPVAPPPVAVPPAVLPPAPTVRPELPPSTGGKRPGIPLLAAAAAVIVVAAAVWFLWPSKPETVLRLEGSTTVGDALAPALLEAFARSEGGKDIVPAERKEEVDASGAKFARIQVRATLPGNSHQQLFEVTANGSGNAFKALKNKTADVGMASRRINDKETADLQQIGVMRSRASEIVVGLDGIAIIVNRSNRVPTLTRKQIADIFSGRVSSWAEFGGGAIPITLYGRNSDSGTFDSFVAMVFGGKKAFSPDLHTKENGEAIAEAVASDPGGIGYVGLPQIGAAKAVPVSDGPGTAALLPSPFTVATEDYILSRRLYLYLPESPSSLARRFAAFAQSPEGQAVVKQIRFVEQTVEFEAVQTPRSAPPRYQDVVSGKRRSSVNFRFEPGSFDLDNKALADIERVVTGLSGAKVNDVYLLGFADNKGTWPDNLRLSAKRADVVADTLKASGITVHPEGFSYDMPVADNTSEEGRGRNRRVEVWVP